MNLTLPTKLNLLTILLNQDFDDVMPQLLDRAKWYGMVWYGMVWYGMVWYGMVWYGMVWYGKLYLMTLAPTAIS